MLCNENGFNFLNFYSLVVPEKIDPTQVVLMDDGNILWVPPANFKVQCNVNGTNAYLCTLKVRDPYSCQLKVSAAEHIATVSL